MTGDADSAPAPSCRSSPTSARASVGRGLQRYKTELCRQFDETGSCWYGTRCQFAHGRADLRSVVRHPKYKTDLCRTFHRTGLCPYGTRCHFIHNDDDRSSSAAAVGLEPLRAPPANIASGIEFDVERDLLELVLSAFDPAITVDHHHHHHQQQQQHPEHRHPHPGRSTPLSCEALTDSRGSCGSAASSTSPSADILNWTSAE